MQSVRIFECFILQRILIVSVLHMQHPPPSPDDKNEDDKLEYKLSLGWHKQNFYSNKNNVLAIIKLNKIK